MRNLPTETGQFWKDSRVLRPCVGLLLGDVSKARLSGFSQLSVVKPVHITDILAISEVSESAVILGRRFDNDLLGPVWPIRSQIGGHRYTSIHVHRWR